jgi:hypothetical protein
MLVPHTKQREALDFTGLPQVGQMIVWVFSGLIIYIPVLQNWVDYTISSSGQTIQPWLLVLSSGYG